MQSNIISLSSEYHVSAAQAEKLLTLQCEILEKVALGVDYKQILDDLCIAAEAMVADAVASIMMFDASGEFLTVLAAPSIPSEAVIALNGLVSGEQAGSCGTAVYSGEAQFVVNTKKDQHWCALQQFAADFGIGACWSCPVKVEKDKAIGSFALSSFEQRVPSAFYKQLLETSAHIVGIIIKRQQEEQSLWDLAHYDALTGLANRTLFNERFAARLKDAIINKQSLALLMLDLDGFKDVNDTQGHDIGDLVLQRVAENVQRVLSTADVFARLGGDEFVILLGYSGDQAVIEHLAEQILSLFQQKIAVAMHTFALSTSIGISLFPENGRSTQVLLRNADTAMYAAKKSGRNCARFYSVDLTRSVRDRMELMTDMRLALLKQEFVLHYQPQYCQLSNDLVGVEALVRWQHPTKGLIAPNIFIPVAEASGFIKELGLWIFSEACRQCMQWWASGIPYFSLAINLSVKQLNTENIQQFQEVLASLSFPIQWLELEVTESLVMQQSSLDELKKLDALGISISMDDFGTGHSSLAQLKHLPISKLKIDRSFVKDLESNESDKVIARTIIAMGHSLGLKIVAEGVETKGQQDYLVQHGCDIIQGYLLSRPLPASKVVELFSRL